MLGHFNIRSTSLELMSSPDGSKLDGRTNNRGHRGDKGQTGHSPSDIPSKFELLFKKKREHKHMNNRYIDFFKRPLGLVRKAIF